MHRLSNFAVEPLNPAYSSPDGVLFDQDQPTLIAYPGAKPGGYVVPDGVTDIKPRLPSRYKTNELPVRCSRQMHGSPSSVK